MMSRFSARTAQEARHLLFKTVIEGFRRLRLGRRGGGARRHWRIHIGGRTRLAGLGRAAQRRLQPLRHVGQVLVGAGVELRLGRDGRDLRLAHPDRLACGLAFAHRLPLPHRLARLFALPYRLPFPDRLAFAHWLTFAHWLALDRDVALADDLALARGFTFTNDRLAFARGLTFTRGLALARRLARHEARQAGRVGRERPARQFGQARHLGRDTGERIDPARLASRGGRWWRRQFGFR